MNIRSGSSQDGKKREPDENVAKDQRGVAFEVVLIAHNAHSFVGDELGRDMLVQNAGVGSVWSNTSRSRDLHKTKVEQHSGCSGAHSDSELDPGQIRSFVGTQVSDFGRLVGHNDGFVPGVFPEEVVPRDLGEVDLLSRRVCAGCDRSHVVVLTSES